MTKVIDLREGVVKDTSTTIIFGNEGEKLVIGSPEASYVEIVEDGVTMFELYYEDIETLIKALRKTKSILVELQEPEDDDEKF